MTTETIKISAAVKGHRARIRSRLKIEPLSVADYEVMELLLGLSITRKDTKILAKELLARFGSFRGALDARPDELEQVPGFGEGLSNLWCLIREIMARYHASPILERQALCTPQAVALMAKSRLGNKPNEECWLALVDAQNQLISWERIRAGSISSINLEPRDILERALKHKASGIILVHNHPGGSALPSRADRELTNEVSDLAERLSLRLLDHVIVTTGDCYSIKLNKVLQNIGG